MSELHSLPAHLWQDEVWLSFHPDREEDRDRHPLKGLRRFGPLSGSLISSMMDPIRVAAVVPQGCRSWFTGILAELNQSHQLSERAAYLVEYPGFSSAFRVRIVQAGGHCRELPQATDAAIESSGTPHRELADRLLTEVNALRCSSAEFDVLYLFLPEHGLVASAGHRAKTSIFTTSSRLNALPPQCQCRSCEKTGFCSTSVALASCGDLALPHIARQVASRGVLPVPILEPHSSG